LQKRKIKVSYVVETGRAAEDELVSVGLENFSLTFVNLLVHEDADGLEAGRALQDLVRNAVVFGRNLEMTKT
jgi:hypothetical protein